MKTLTFRRNYKYILLFIFLIFVSIVFSQTRIISYNFGRYVTQLEISQNDIQNSVEIFDEDIFHNIQIQLTAQEYEDLIVYYINNDDKYYAKTNIVIDGVEIQNVWVKLKGTKIISQSIDEIDLSSWDISLFIKFDEFVTDQSYLSMTELSLISGTTQDLSNEFIATKVFQYFWVTSPQASFANVEIGDLVATQYLVKQVVNDEFLTQEYGDDLGLLYKAENSLSFTYLWEDPTLYADLFTQKTLENNYDLKKLIEVLDFVSNSDDEEFKLEANKYIDIQNYAYFLAINTYLYQENPKISFLDSYYIYYDLSSQTIEFIPWDAQYIDDFEETSLYTLLQKFYSKQQITQLSKKDIRELLWNITQTIPSELSSKYSHDLESIFLDNDTFQQYFEEVQQNIENTLSQEEIIQNLEIKINNLYVNNTLWNI